MTPGYYECGNYETVDKQETIAKHLIRALDVQQVGHVMTAIKYIDRMGRKEGADFDDDARKAADYICRAFTGTWLDD